MNVVIYSLNLDQLLSYGQCNFCFGDNEVGQCMKMMRFCVCEIVVWLNLQLDPLEFQTAIQWWLGISFSHHAIVVPGHVVACLNRLWDVFVESYWRACVGVQVEVGNGYGLHEHSK